MTTYMQTSRASVGLEPMEPADLHNRYRDFLSLSPAELAARASEALVAEDRLPEGRRREAVYRRLCAWLDLDPEEARIIAAAFERAKSMLPGDVVDRRIEDERDALFHGFRFGEFRRLASLLPWTDTERGLALTQDIVAGAA